MLTPRCRHSRVIIQLILFVSICSPTAIGALSCPYLTTITHKHREVFGCIIRKNLQILLIFLYYRAQLLLQRALGKIFFWGGEMEPLTQKKWLPEKTTTFIIYQEYVHYWDSNLAQKMARQTASLLLEKLLLIEGVGRFALLLAVVNRHLGRTDKAVSTADTQRAVFIDLLQEIAHNRQGGHGTLTARN